MNLKHLVFVLVMLNMNYTQAQTLTDNQKVMNVDLQQTRKEIEDEVVIFFSKWIGSSYFEDENEYGEAEKVTKYRWLTDIKNGYLIFAASYKSDTRPLHTTEFDSHKSFDIVYIFPIQYYQSINKIRNGIQILSNKDGSCKYIEKNIVYRSPGFGDNEPHPFEDEVKYYRGFDFSYDKEHEGAELSDEDISFLDKLLKKYKATF